MSAIHPLDHLAVTIAAILFVGAVALTVPVFIGRRRRQSTDAVAWADRLRRDPAAAWGADRALRGVLAACVRDRVGFPGIARCSVGTTVTMQLASPTLGPPTPWSSTPDGRTWSAPMWAVQSIALDDAVSADAFATVVALGTDDAGTVLADLRTAHGVVALRGDRAGRTAVARRIVDQFGTNPWSIGTPVLSVGIGHGELGATTSVSLAEGIGAVQDNTTPGVLVLADMPRRAGATSLARALEKPGNRWGVVVLGSAAHPRWELTVDRDGTMTSAALGTIRWVDLGLRTPVPLDGADAQVPTSVRDTTGV